jgi:hypothetical protein
MTEAEWLASTDPSAMLEFLRGSGRKVRLAACACVRHGVWPLLTDERYRKAIEAREAHEDGLVGPAELEETQTGAWRALMEAVVGVSGAPDEFRAVAEAVGQPHPSGIQRARASGNICEWLLDGEARWAAETERWAERVLEFAARAAASGTAERAVQCGLLRCVFGNPFEPIALGSGWLTPTVVSIAKAAYDERLLASGEMDPLRLVVLADALEEIGASGELLDHLRSPGPHVRGCWALDLILGKS